MDFEAVIKLLAREAAARDDGMTISPLFNIDRKGGAYVTVFQQLKKAIGVAIAQGNVEHKMVQLYYFREAAEEAKATFYRHRSNSKWNLCGRSN